MLFLVQFLDLMFSFWIVDFCLNFAIRFLFYEYQKMLFGF